MFGKVTPTRQFAGLVSLIQLTICPAVGRIDFIRRTLEDSQSIVAVPVIGSLVSPTLFSRRDANCTDISSIFCIVCDTDSVLPAGYQALLPEYVECRTMDADGLLRQMGSPESTSTDIPSPGMKETGMVCFSCGRSGHGVSQCSCVDTAFPSLPLGWSVDFRDC